MGVPVPFIVGSALGYLLAPRGAVAKTAGIVAGGFAAELGVMLLVVGMLKAKGVDITGPALPAETT